MRPSTSLLRSLMGKRDFYAGGLMLLLGLGIALKGVTYRAGTLMHMGPGFFPTSLGVLLVILGIAIAATGLSSSPAEAAGEHSQGESILPEHPQWWGWLCILLSPVFFIFFGSKFGMAPGTFACVAIAACGDKQATWKSTVILATVVTIFGVSLFSYFLQVPMPIFSWWGSQ
ncbi:MAG: tripartite tricarboxylate transporter TctB family protein [Xanthobacteraceae bacterium]